MYQISRLWKFAEVDDYENGCLLEGGHDVSIDLRFTGHTIDEVVEKARAFVGCDADAVERNACDEVGRVDFAKTENADSRDPSPAEIAAWKDGKCTLYYCVYSGHVEKIERVSA